MFSSLRISFRKRIKTCYAIILGNHYFLKVCLWKNCYFIIWFLFDIVEPHLCSHIQKISYSSAFNLYGASLRYSVIWWSEVLYIQYQIAHFLQFLVVNGKLVSKFRLRHQKIGLQFQFLFVQNPSQKKCFVFLVTCFALIDI